MLDQINNYYLQQEEPYKSCLLALRNIILSASKEITPEWKYGMPFFYYKKKMFCYFWKDRKTQEPYIGFFCKKEVEHHLLEKGDRKRVQIFRVNPNEDIDVENLEKILAMALRG